MTSDYYPQLHSFARTLAPKFSSPREREEYIAALCSREEPRLDEHELDALLHQADFARWGG